MKKSFLLLAIGLGLAILMPALLAQEAAGPLDTEYRLVVGDTITVVVEGYPDLGHDYTVPPNGEVSVPPLGKVNLLDRTVDQIETELTKRFKEAGQLTNPHVSVLIKANAPRQVYFMGATAGAIPLYPYKQYTLLQVLALAHVTPGSGDLRNVKILRKKPDGKKFAIEVNVEDILDKNVFDKDLIVMPDDIIYVPSFESVSNVSYVYILGKVRTPGRFSYIPGREQLTLTRLIALAGDFTQFAKQSEIRILRKEGNRTRTIDLDFSDIIENKIPDEVLQADDLVYVPESPW